ncbi:MAG TPA: hypothetical protein DDY98_09305 [Ruminococcaceae bacterium]|nr:hypothetical protein [Oscillospiraceae bacterium]
MRKSYNKPFAEKIEFNYSNQVVTDSNDPTSPKSCIVYINTNSGLSTGKCTDGNDTPIFYNDKA